MRVTKTIKYFLGCFTLAVFLFSISGCQDRDNMVSGNFTQNNLDLLPLQVTQPDLMEVWKPGTTHQITWNADPLFEHIRLELYRKEEFKFIISSNEPNRGELKWTVPGNLALSHHYRIKIVSEDYPSRYEYSDFFFVLNQ